MLLCQIPAMVLGAVFGVLFSIIWITIISVCFLALTGIWIWQTYELHGLLLASEQRVAEAEQAFRKDMTEAGAPVSLIDQIVAHLDDDDLTGANLVLTKFLGGTP